ncbi:TPA: LexA family transcriptional regulator, partial [Vibrio cholerae]
MKTLSERLNHALQLTGVTQSELARRIGIKQ